MCRRYTTYKTVVILQPVKLGYMFPPLPGHHQTNKEIVLIKVHSLALPMGSSCLNFKLLESILMVKKLLNLKFLIKILCDFKFTCRDGCMSCRRM